MSQIRTEEVRNLNDSRKTQLCHSAFGVAILYALLVAGRVLNNQNNNSLSVIFTQTTINQDFELNSRIQRYP